MNTVVNHPLLKKFGIKTLLFLLCLQVALALGVAQAQVPKVIFDSDMSSDWDDVGDIAVLHGLANLGECEIIGMMQSSQNGGTPLCMDAINTYYGRPDIPIGVRADSLGIGGYPGQIANEFPHGPETSYTDFPEAVSLYRQLLAASPNKSVMIVTAGYLNNLAGLLQSGPDQHSSLNGVDLVNQKVKIWVCAGGAFPSGSEFNFKVEPEASSYVINNWPTAVTYTPFKLGPPYKTGRWLPDTPTTNPIRRVYVDIEDQYPYASWTQTAMYEAIRGNSENFWAKQNNGHNTADSTGDNFWLTDYDPVDPDDQAYLLERTRFPVIRALDALMISAPVNGPPSVPGWPTNMRAVVNGSQVALSWTDNAYNETGFTIEYENNGTYTPLASVGANVTNYTHTGVANAANTSYRVKATNAVGDSQWEYCRIYSGWTEYNFHQPSNLPLYHYFRDDQLTWGKEDYRPDHLTVNNDSNHGQDLTINVFVGAQGQEGNAYVYFFFQDPDNWYRLSTNSTECKFEKSVGGTVTQIGASGAPVKLSSGGGLEDWTIQVTAAGNMTFTREMPYTAAAHYQFHDRGQLLNVNDTMSYTSGKIALGGYAQKLIWQNFDFSTTGGGGGTPPDVPTSLAANAGDTQVSLSWTASTGATSYNVYRSTTSGGQGGTPVVTGVSSPNYTDNGLTNGTTYYYTVAAVNANGTSAQSGEASATPAGSGGGGNPPAAPTGLVATGGDGQVSLSWVASSGADSYNVYRGTSSGGQSGTPVATGLTSTSYTDSGVANGTTYYYTVAAVNTDGTSSQSAEDSATPAGSGGGGGNALTGTVIGTSGAYGGGGNTIDKVFDGNFSTFFDAPMANGSWAGLDLGTAHVIEQVKYAPRYGFPGRMMGGQLQGANASDFSDAVTLHTVASSPAEGALTSQNISNPTAFRYVRYLSPDGGWGNVSEVEFHGTEGSGGGSAPAAPTGLAATGGDGQVSLSWTASSGADTYNVYRGTSSGGQGGTPIASGVSTASYTDSGVSNGTTYYYTVAAVNTNGTSAQSGEASATPAGSGGGGGGTEDFLNGSFESPSLSGFSYNPAGSDWMFTNNAGIQSNGSAYSGSSAVAPDGVQTGFVQGVNSTLGTMSQSVSLDAGTYTISFQAARRYGSVQPVEITVNGTTLGTYTPASNSFGLMTTSEFAVANGSHTITFAATDATADKTTFIDSLVLNVVSGGGGGGGTPPATPTGLGATAGDQQVSLNWTTSSGADTYNVYRGTSSGGQNATPVATGVTVTSYTDTGLSNGVSYFYTVAAVNAEGTSAQSAEASAMPMASGGGGGNEMLENGSFENPTVNSYSYTPSGSEWTFSNFAGIQKNGSVYGAANAPDGVQTALLQGHNSTLGSMSQSVQLDTGLYTISFQAARRSGQTQPIEVSVDGNSLGTYTPSSNSFELITTAEFAVSSGTSTITFAATDNTGDKTTFVDAVEITASGSGGGGGGSAPAAPAVFAATAGDGQISLTWAGDANTASYNLYRGTSSGGQGGTPVVTGMTTEAYTDSGLDNGTTYYYTVTAVNAQGESGASNEVSATPAAQGGGGGGGGTATFANGGFETPVISGFTYTPSGSSWTFANYAGIQHNGSAYSGSSAVAPEGGQTAFIQGHPVHGLGSMSQQVALDPGTYEVSFYAARRYGSIQPLSVQVDGVEVGVYTPASGSFELITSDAFIINTAGTYTITLAATDDSSDRTAFVDLIAIDVAGGGGGGGGGAPAAPLGVTATPGNSLVTLNWSASSGATSYEVYRGTVSNGQGGTPLATGVGATTFTDSGLANGTTYYYKVRAVGPGGTSVDSDEASAMPMSANGDIDLTGYTLTFSDEFDTFDVTTSNPKGASKWYYLPPYGSAGYYSASTWDIDSMSVNNGILEILAYIGEEPGTWGTYWYSGNISSVDETGAGFSQQYGYFEARVKMPESGTGAWPAFWLVTTTGIPAVSPTPVKVCEIDIFEWYGVTMTPGSEQAFMQQASHNWNEDGSQNQTTADHLYSPQTPMPGGAYPWEGFHIYGCKVDPEHITWYIDGVQTNQIDTPTDYLTGPFYIMLDYALGGGWPLDGMVDGSKMEIDWVRVYDLPSS